MNERVDLLLVSTRGGHLQELYALRDAWQPFSRAWVTMTGPEHDSLLRDERVFLAHEQIPRSVRNFGRNLILAWRLIHRLRPKVLLTTGAAVAVPFAWTARLRGVRVVYVELATRIDEPSLACRMIAPVADRVYVQWPELVGAVRRARYAGNVFLSDA